MRIRNRCLFVTLAALLVVFPPAVLAGEGGQSEGQYDITGTWYGINSFGNYTLYTIVKVGPNEYASTMDVLASVNMFGYGSTRMTGYAATIKKTGLNTYDTTWVAFFGDDQNFTPMYFGVMYAVVTSGTVVQTGPDELIYTAYGKVSCNPCWSGALTVCGTQATCSLAEPWDPFDDPNAVCGSSQYNPFINVSHRVPIDSPCTPPSS